MNKTIIFTVMVLGVVGFYALYFLEGTQVLRNDTMVLNTYGRANEPVHMPGCKTFQGPVAPKVIYPTVTQNFVARLCALEVPPSHRAIASQRDEVRIKFY